MQNNQIFHFYEINSLRTITMYNINRNNGQYKIKKKLKESFKNSADLMFKLLILEDRGYLSINTLLCTLNKKEINELFNLNNHKSKKQKNLALSLSKKLNINF